VEPAVAVRAAVESSSTASPTKAERITHQPAHNKLSFPRRLPQSRWNHCRLITTRACRPILRIVAKRRSFEHACLTACADVDLMMTLTGGMDAHINFSASKIDCICSRTRESSGVGESSIRILTNSATSFGSPELVGLRAHDNWASATRVSEPVRTLPKSLSDTAVNSISVAPVAERSRLH
jgi:hypothetical protein